MTAISNTGFVAASLPRRGLTRAVLYSLLLHVLIVVMLHETTWQEPVPELASSPLRIELRQPPPARLAPAPDAPPTDVNEQAASSTAAPETIPSTTSARDDDQPDSATVPEVTSTPASTPATPAASASVPELSVQQLRRQAVATARSQSQKRLDEPDTSSLPSNWTRDALPGKATAAPEYLEPLNYTGPTGTRQWQQADGQMRSETVLADGTVVCGRGHTLMPNSNFETTLIMSGVCGKKTGSERENRNALSRFHPGNVDSVLDAAQAADESVESDSVEE